MQAAGSPDEVGYTVGDLARVAGVTVRTLHHYDAIGLLVPSGRTPAGYRTYDYPDVLRLQRVLGYRALGLSLDAIGALLDDPTADPVEQLRDQHALLGARASELQRQIAAIEKAMEAHAMGIQLTPEEMFEVFGDGDPTEHAAEAADRWADTDAYRQSQRRTSRYTKADWQQMKVDTALVEAGFVAVYRSGAPATSPAAMDTAEAHRQNITKWFYDCSPGMHRALAQMYVEDERFTAHYEDHAEGLAQFVHDAVTANADRAS